MPATLNESCSCSFRASSVHPSSIPLDRTSTSIARRPSIFHHFFPILLEALRSVVAATTAWLVLITRQSFVNTRPTTLITIARQSFVSACLALSCFCLIVPHKPMTWLVPNCVSVGCGAGLASPNHAAEPRPRRSASASASTRLSQGSHTRPESRLLERISPKPGWEGSALRNTVQGKKKGTLVSGVYHGGAANAASSPCHVSPSPSLSDYHQVRPFDGSIKACS
jgi:hypothetical protein